MPLNYLNNDENMYAAQNLGHGFAQALSAPGRMRLIQMQEARKRQIEDAYLGLAQQQEARQSASSKQTMQLNAADEARRNEVMQAARTYADMIARSRFQLPRQSVSPASNPYAQNLSPEQYQHVEANRDATRAASFIAAQSPQVAGRMLEPMQFNPGPVFDPITRELALSVPYQQRPMTEAEHAHAVFAKDQAARMYHQGLMRQGEQHRHNTVMEGDRETPQQRFIRDMAMQTMRLRANPAVAPSKFNDAVSTGAGMLEDYTNAGQSTRSAGSQRAASTTTFKDKSGKTWQYKGRNPNPTSDRDPANWQEVK